MRLNNHQIWTEIGVSDAIKCQIVQMLGACGAFSPHQQFSLISEKITFEPYVDHWSKASLGLRYALCRAGP